MAVRPPRRPSGKASAGKRETKGLNLFPAESCQCLNPLCTHLPRITQLCALCCPDRLVGLVVKASASRAEGPGFESRAGIFSGSSHTSDFKIDTPVATLPGAWRYGVSAGTGRPGVSILWLGEMESVICSFYLSVAARKIVCADPSLRYLLACCWDVKQPTNKQTVLSWGNHNTTSLFTLHLGFVHPLQAVELRHSLQLCSVCCFPVSPFT